MKKILTILFIAIAICSCQKDNIGYLVTENAGYSVSELIVKSELQDGKSENPEYKWYLDNGYTPAQIAQMNIDEYIYEEDYFRALKKMPWVSGEINGVEGTAQIIYEIYSVTSSNNGDINVFMSTVEVDGGGRIIVPFEHNVPKGDYLITLKIKNEGQTQYLKDIFTVKFV